MHCFAFGEDTSRCNRSVHWKHILTGGVKTLVRRKYSELEHNQAGVEKRKPGEKRGTGVKPKSMRKCSYQERDEEHMLRSGESTEMKSIWCRAKYTFQWNTVLRQNDPPIELSALVGNRADAVFLLLSDGSNVWKRFFKVIMKGVRHGSGWWNGSG